MQESEYSFIASNRIPFHSSLELNPLSDFIIMQKIRQHPTGTAGYNTK